MAQTQGRAFVGNCNFWPLFLLHHLQEVGGEWKKKKISRIKQAKFPVILMFFFCFLSVYSNFLVFLQTKCKIYILKCRFFTSHILRQTDENRCRRKKALRNAGWLWAFDQWAKQITGSWRNKCWLSLLPRHGMSSANSVLSRLRHRES